jgi:hypothetical protein
MMLNTLIPSGRGNNDPSAYRAKIIPIGLVLGDVEVLEIGV